MKRTVPPKPSGEGGCTWPGTDDLYIRYHDEEWGRPVVDDTRLFEKICLEGFQSGLSWITILRKRENFRRVRSKDGREIQRPRRAAARQ
jgi:DNA-3-methyladenine glycosylase I